MAGLPKRILLVLCAFVFLASLSTLAQTDPIEPELPDPVIQTPSDVLQPIIDLVESSAVATAEQKQALIDTFSDLIDLEQLTVDQATESLLVVGWEAPELEEDLTLALGLLNDTLAGVASGDITDPVAALIGAYNSELTPDGIVNAITKAGASDETLAQAESLVAAGLPPGIVLRVTKDALRDGLTQEEIDAMLETLAVAYAEGEPAGQAANAATGQGSYKYEEQEQEVNTNEGENEEPEAEKNNNGKRDNGKKK